MKTRRRLVTTFASCAFIAMALMAFWLTIRVRAFNPQPDPPAFGLVSVNPGQTLRLNVVNRLQPPPEPDRLGRSTRHAMLAFNMYRADVPPGPCATAHLFADRQSCEVTLAPGEAASFDLTSATEIGLTQVLFSLGFDLIVWDRSIGPVTVAGIALIALPAAWLVRQRPI